MSGPVARCAIRPKAHSGRPRLPLLSRQRQPCEPENAYLGRCRARGRAVGRKARWMPMRYLMDEASRDEGQSPPMKRPGAVFVERLTRQWVVRDPEGNFWILPTVDDPWRN